MIFSFLAIFHVLQWTFLTFPPFSVFLAIFHVLKCVFLIFRDFQFSRHIPGPTVCISHFSIFSVISSFFKCQMDVSHYTWFSVFLPYSVSYSRHLKFFHLFSFPRHIFHPKVCISHFPWFLVLSIFQVLQCAFLIFHVFQYFLSYFTT